MGSAGGAGPYRVRRSLRQREAFCGDGIDDQARGTYAACRYVLEGVAVLGINLLLGGPNQYGPTLACARETECPLAFSVDPRRCIRRGEEPMGTLRIWHRHPDVQDHVDRMGGRHVAGGEVDDTIRSHDV